MKIKFKRVLLIAVLTTLVALIASFVALPNNSGYAGLFFIASSPIFICVFIIWTYVLLAAISRNEIFRKLIVIILITIVFEYLVAVLTMVTISSDSRDYSLNVFLSDCASLFFDKEILFCTVTIATVYALLLKYMAIPSKDRSYDK
ncbi:hypothetical protein IM793_23600 [Pedobacter sp. MR2016-19]|uniref:hypothetical protein n=1 Tax=unclassified Pedobacter TaxID=2628915 RepID=UPI001876F438|nr:MULTISPECIES: hypothetical protein [unclassified Pedobacter]MBE5322158.1 hypothetical protein [Pedobacter sp. MR2016-19]QXU42857.1 hypothetical protein KYH19_04455 [Pedobacter sp. D749]